MVSGAETVVADEWIHFTLISHPSVSAIVDDRIYFDVAPRDAQMPFIVIQEQDASDFRGVGPVNVFTTTLYIVKAIAQGDSYMPLQPIAKAIYDALHDSKGVAPSGGRIVSCLREAPFRLQEFSEGKSFRHLGGRYSLQVQGT